MARGGYSFEVSQPPAPFVIRVEEARYYPAQNQAALAGVSSHGSQGIQSETGAADAFLSAGKRAQIAQKREWQELEKQLEELNFVARAHVSTSVRAPDAGREARPLTVAVTLVLRAGIELAAELDPHAENECLALRLSLLCQTGSSKLHIHLPGPLPSLLARSKPSAVELSARLGTVQR